MVDLLKENLHLLKNLFEECLVAKNNPNEPKASLEEKIKVGSLFIVLIKKVNRGIKCKLRTGRDELQYQKSQVDCNRLHLQNLLYEVNYLKREIRHCYQFKSQDEDIDIEETPVINTESSSMDMETDKNPVCANAIQSAELSHAERLARLERELLLRKQLASNYSQLFSAKADLYKDIFSITEDLSTFAPSLRTLLKATRPLQDALQLPYEENWKLEQKIHLLPQCLYLAYINLRTLEINDPNFKIAVKGSEVEVDDYEITRKANTNLQPHHQPAQSQSQFKIFQNSYEKIQFLQPHPLQLQIKISDAEFPNDILYINFYYMPLLDVVTAHSDMCFSAQNISGNDQSFLQNGLRFIYDNDIGKDFPKPEIGVKLEKAEISKEEFYEFLTAYNFGLPYRWLQHLCGNRTWNNQKVYNLQEERLKEFANDIIRRIKTYLNCRLRLLAQVRAFLSKNWECLVTERLSANKMDADDTNDDDDVEDGEDEFSVANRPKCSLVQWSSMTWDEFEGLPFTSLHRKQQIIDETFSFCTAILILNAQKMECYIGFSNKHPKCAPFWILNVQWNGEHNAMNNSNVKSMEQWVNNIIQCDSVSTKNILAKQLWRTMRSFDQFLELNTPNDRVDMSTNEKRFSFRHDTQFMTTGEMLLDGNNSPIATAGDSDSCQE